VNIEKKQNKIMKQQLQHPNAVKHTIEHKLYQEFDKDNKVVFTRKMKHGKSVSFVVDGLWETESDKWGRTTFHKCSNGYWHLKFYDEPRGTENPSVTAYQVVHSAWHLYNDLK